ncbi:MAG: hypothetical protein ACRD4P_00630 [Bryobacteraceae bacterium]
MRRLKLAAVFLMVLAISASGCKRRKHHTQAATETGDVGLRSTLAMNDPRGGLQLIKGFHQIEAGGWRWTAGQFSVNLKTPPNAGQNGAQLVFALSAPAPVIDKFKSITLSAKINGLALTPQTYSNAGDYQYERDVPAYALRQDTVQADFSLDKYFPAGELEARELGIIAKSIGLVSK